MGDEVEKRLHFGQFLRLELGDTWYKASDDSMWRCHFKLKKVSEAADDTDYNNDGDKVDEVWIDNGSDTALDNAGF